ncbi:MAG: methylated-DNA--[protein]-cysteine S-methyltransferase [Deltaproteobacteria bacterium]|jgi:methylated-DNA-[protein]-cysteine S-methyltransferase|nr:methylated-DNA--[protein]-cysteine S-methyltransferase [Deltaproteobacteria bacterium]
MRYEATFRSPIGDLAIACEDEYLVSLWFVGQKYHGGANLPGGPAKAGGSNTLAATLEWLRAYFAGERPGSFRPAIAMQGSAFRMAVWNALLDIPFGEVVSYGDIARVVAARTGGKASAARAVGGAVGRNPISIVIPCHRVVGSNGGLTGYGAGIERKVYLLGLEGLDPHRLRVQGKR